MPRSLSLPLTVVALLVVASVTVPTAAVVSTDSVAFATDGHTVDGEDGGTYQRPVTVLFDVEANGTYELRTASDRTLVAQLPADDGTVAVDTTALDPREYVIVNDSQRVVYEFTVEADPDATETATEEAGDEESASPPNEPAEALRVEQAGRRNATLVAERGVFYRGQLLRFRVDGDVPYVLVSPTGENLGAFDAVDHGVYVNTSTLAPGVYRLRRRGGPTVYHVAIETQTLEATADGTTVRLDSNRRAYRVVVEGVGLSRSAIAEAFPGAVVRDGRVVVEASGGDSLIAVDETALAPGNCTLTLRVLDTGANTTVTVAVPDPRNASSDAGTATPRVLPQTATATPTASTTTSPPATSPQVDTDDGTSISSRTTATAASATGFGVSTALVATAVGTAALHRRRRSR